MQRLLPRWIPKDAHRPRATSRPHDDGALRLRWLGTAGHVVATATTTILLDPYLSRARFRALLRPLVPDPSAHRGWLPPRVDAIALGHSHFDHLLDAPAIAIATGARIIGSATTAAFARATGVPEDRIDVVPPEGRTVRVGDIDVAFVPSLHGRIALGRVPLPGEVTRPPALPVGFHRYRMGGAFGILLAAGGRTVYHNGSADLVDAELEGRRADVVLMGLAGRRATRDYAARLVRALSPSVVFPTHHDAFFGPLDDGERLLPGVDLGGFARELRELAPEARLVTPLYDDEAFVPLAGDPRDVALYPR